jgi:hypothetical protein
MATPSVLFYSPSNKKGFALLTEQKSNVGDYSLGIKENEDRSKAEISLSAPAVRVKYKYSMCTMKAKSDDVGFDLSENDEVRLRFRLYFFECENITSLFSYFVNIRKDLSGPGELLNRFTFSSSFDIQQEKYNKYNWQKEYEFYTVGVNDNIFNEWQSGWVGGGMNSYPLLLEGNTLSKERALKNLEFAFEKAQAPNVLFYGIVYKGKPYGDCFDGQNDSDWLLIRKHADVVYFLGKHFSLAEHLGIDIPENWKKGYKKSCDVLVRLWRKYQQFGQFVNIKNEEIIIGGSTSAASAPAALALAFRYFSDEEYLSVACAAAEHFYKNFTARGVTCGAPGEACQCPDSESAFAILDSYVVLYETTNAEQWRAYAIDAANQCASWCVSYDFQYEEDAAFAKYDMHTLGAVWANAQNKHAGPGICTLSGDSLFKLYRMTGNQLYLRMIQEIAHNLPQYLSREDRPLYTEWCFDDNKYNGSCATQEKILPGFMNERVNTCDWEGKENIGGIPGGSCWCEVSNMLSYAELPSIYIQKDTGLLCVFDHVEAEIIGRTDKYLQLRIVNPTQYSAILKLFTENSTDTNKILGQNSMLNCIKAEVKQGAEKIISIEL